MADYPYIERNVVFSRDVLKQWELQQVYPEDRFQLGVARAVSENVAHQNSIRVIHESEADRLTGICERTEANGRAEIIELGSRFWLNSTPR